MGKAKKTRKFAAVKRTLNTKRPTSNSKQCQQQQH